jgi:hypothetical protein
MMKLVISSCLQSNVICLLYELHETHKHSVWEKFSFCVLTCWYVYFLKCLVLTTLSVAKVIQV